MWLVHENVIVRRESPGSILATSVATASSVRYSFAVQMEIKLQAPLHQSPKRFRPCMSLRKVSIPKSCTDQLFLLVPELFLWVPEFHHTGIRARLHNNWDNGYPPLIPSIENQHFHLLVYSRSKTFYRASCIGFDALQMKICQATNTQNCRSTCNTPFNLHSYISCYTATRLA